jgi:transcriptional regulator with XRE-family HTH domain
MTLGETIKDARKFRRVSQRWLASRCGVSASTIGRWERSDSALWVRQINVVARALDCVFLSNRDGWQWFIAFGAFR